MSFARRWLFQLRRRWWVVALVWGFTGVYIVYRTATAVPVFRPQATLEVTPETPILTTPEDEWLSAQRYMWTNYVQTQMQVIRSRGLSEKVIKELPSPLREEFEKSYDGASKFASHVVAEDDRNSFLLRIGYVDTDRNRATEAVNTLTKVYLSEASRRYNEVGDVRAGHLGRQTLPELKKNYDEAAARLRESQQVTGAIDLEELHRLRIGAWRAVNDRLLEVRLRRVRLRAKVDVMKTVALSNLSSIPTSLLRDNLLVSDLVGQRFGVLRQFNQNMMLYREKHPTIAMMRQQLATLDEQIREVCASALSGVKTDLEEAMFEEAGLKEELKACDAATMEIASKLIRSRQLEMEVATARGLYDEYFKKFGEASAVSGAPLANIRIMELARVPDGPWKTVPTNELIVVALSGFCLGLLAVYGLERFDDRVRSHEEVETLMGLNVLAAVPAFENTPKTGDVVLLDENATWSSMEPFRRLRIEVLARLQKIQGARAIAVLSTLKGEGKTTIAANLARSVAIQGLRVLLVDADMHHPQMRKLFGVREGGNFIEYLRGKCDSNQCVAQTMVPRLFVTGASEGSTESSDLSSSSRFYDAVKAWKTQFDIILLDSPPLLAVSESSLIARYADTAILVVRERQARRNTITGIKKRLMAIDVKFLGAVVNFATVAKESSYYTYGYHYGDSPKPSTKRFNKA